MTGTEERSPVVIGGVGGSGTRVAAEMLLELGFHLGSDLNEALDNLWFTLLFKRPRWYRSARAEREIPRCIDILERALTGRLHPGPGDFSLVLAAAGPMVVHGHDHRGAGRGLWPLKRALTLLSSASRAPAAPGGWGWKEPNSHLYLRHLAAFFPRLRFIYVMRHGLDMAWSGNQAQLHNWGDLFGVKPSAAPRDEPRAALDYWIRASRRAIDDGSRLLGERFLALNFDALCRDPAGEAGKLVDFLGLTADKALIDRLAGLPRMPSSAGRYRERDLSIFDPAALRAVEELGFPV